MGMDKDGKEGFPSLLYNSFLLILPQFYVFCGPLSCQTCEVNVPDDECLQKIKVFGTLRIFKGFLNTFTEDLIFKGKGVLIYMYMHLVQICTYL